MQRRQFLKGMLAVPAVALLPTGYTEAEEVWTNVVTLGNFEEAEIRFIASGLEAGDYIHISGHSYEKNNGIYEVKSIERNIATVIPKGTRSGDSRSRDPGKLRGRRVDRSRSGRSDHARHLDHLSGRRGVGSHRGRWRTFDARSQRVHS